METLTKFRLGDLQLVQAEAGYRFSLDPVLLARFITVQAEDQIVDLGAGSGVISLLLARLSPARHITGLELQPDLVRRAQRNVELNCLQDVVRIIEGDVRKIKTLLPAAQTDLIVSNPPYRKLQSGRVAPNPERAVARHEMAGGVEDFVSAAAWLLKNGGRLGLIFLAERLPELICSMVAWGIEPKRLRMVHPQPGESAKMVLVEGRKGGRPGLGVDPPLMIYQGPGREYTAEVLRMYGETA